MKIGPSLRNLGAVSVLPFRTNFYRYPESPLII